MNVLNLPYKARVVLYQSLKLASAIAAVSLVVAPLFGWELPQGKVDAFNEIIVGVISLLGLGVGAVASEHAKISFDGPLQDPRVPVEPPTAPVVADALAHVAARGLDELVKRLEELGKPEAE